MSASFEDFKLEAALEAMLFVTNEPVSSLVMADILETDVSKVEESLHLLSQKLVTSNSGIQLREVAGGWRLFTHPAYHELIEKYVLSWDTRKLSAAAMETLAIIAYTQPVTRSGVAQIRGVNSDSTISSLVEKRLVREVGVADTPGNPSLYGTTHVFLEKFGFKSVSDLPPLEDFAPDEETARLISDRLSATRSTSDVSEAQAFMMAEEMLYGGETELDSGAVNEVLAAALGVVEKIDFDELQFDFDEE